MLNIFIRVNFYESLLKKSCGRDGLWLYILVNFNEKVIKEGVLGIEVY